MLHRIMLALIAMSSVRELPMQALTIAFLAEVVTDYWSIRMQTISTDQLT